MKAFKVFYSTNHSSDNMIVLAEDVSALEEAVAKKDKEFKIGEKWSRSKIEHYEEIPMSNVKLFDLSMEEFKSWIYSTTM